MIPIFAIIFCVTFLPGMATAVDDTMGEPTCPCLTELPSSLINDVAIYREDENCLSYENAGSSFCFPLNYGLSNCAKHDQNLSPYCIDHGFPGVPDFCEQSWCWVDPSNCEQDHYPSSFFPGHGLYYSYQTCGSANSFVGWFSGEIPKRMTDLISIVERYVILTKGLIEERYADTEEYVMTKDREDIRLECADRNSCSNCSAECSYNDCWRMNVNFEGINTVCHPRLQRMVTQQVSDMLACLGNIVGNSYLRTTYLEHNNVNRIGYMYFGHQESGCMFQWPETTFCSENFDVRFRPWYALTVSGPKDVVIVVDTSGSMDKGTRMPMAIESVKAVLQTLTWVDHVSIIGFDTVVNDVYSEILVPATEENVRQMTEWAENMLDAGGTSEFKPPLERAYAMLKTSRNTNDRNTCSQIILFVTDGEDSLDDTELEQLVNDNSGPENGPTIFTYGLSSDADEKALKKMACATNGIYFPVLSSDDLPSKMASYYNYFIATLDSCQVNWIKYTDFITGEDLLASCVAIFDYGSDGSLPSGLRKLVGVSCLDMNVIASLDQLQSCQSGGFDEFLDIVNQIAGTCPAFTKITDRCLLARLRRSVGNSSLCDGDLDFNASCVPEVNLDSESNCSRLDPNRFSGRLTNCRAPNSGGCNKEENSITADPKTKSSDQIAAIAGGAAAGVIVAALFLCFIWRPKNPKPPNPDLTEEPQKEDDDDASHEEEDDHDDDHEEEDDHDHEEEMDAAVSYQSHHEDTNEDQASPPSPPPGEFQVRMPKEDRSTPRPHF